MSALNYEAAYQAAYDSMRHDPRVWHEALRSAIPLAVLAALTPDAAAGDKCREIGHDKRGDDGRCARCLLPLPLPEPRP